MAIEPNTKLTSNNSQKEFEKLLQEDFKDRKLKRKRNHKSNHH